VLRVGQSDPPIRRCYQWRMAPGSIVVVIQPPNGVLRSLRDTAPRGANGDRTPGRPRRYPSGGRRTRRKGGRVAREDTAPVSVASPTVRERTFSTCEEAPSGSGKNPLTAISRPTLSTTSRSWAK
jgi:hypothetical protein